MLSEYKPLNWKVYNWNVDESDWDLVTAVSADDYDIAIAKAGQALKDKHFTKIKVEEIIIKKDQYDC